MRTRTLNLFGVLALVAMGALAGGSSLIAGSPRMVGANVSGAEFGSKYPGVLGIDYTYPGGPDLDWAKSQGLELVRLPFRWERVQHEAAPGVLDSTLWAPDIASLDAVLDACEQRGLRVILDMHNYGQRLMTTNAQTGAQSQVDIGTPVLPAAEFANAWRLLAEHFKGRSCIWGYDIMNEPHTFTIGSWVPMAQGAVTAIRAADPNHAIILEGASWAATRYWTTSGAPLLAVADPVNNLVYSGHCYSDRDSSGTWRNGGTVAAELVGHGYADLASAYQVGVDRVKPFVDWCVAHNVRGLVGEYGSPHSIDTADWNIVLDRMLAYMRDNGNGLISGTQWSSGPWWSPAYVIRMNPRKDSSNPPPVAGVLPAYLTGMGTNYWPAFTWYKDSLTSTLDYAYSYRYASTAPAATCILNVADSSTAYSGTASISLSYTIPAGGYAGAGLHIHGPNQPGGVGGVALARHLAGGHVLAFYAKGAPGANPRITLATTSSANGVDTAVVTATGNWVSLADLAPLSGSWQRYEIPLAAFLNTQLTGSLPVQRIMLQAGPADGASYDVHIDQITIGVPSANTPPAVVLDTEKGRRRFHANRPVTLVAAAADMDAGDGIDYVEFYLDHEKIGLTDVAPYRFTTAFSKPGTYDLTAIAYDSHGTASQSQPIALIIKPQEIEDGDDDRGHEEADDDSRHDKESSRESERRKK